MPWPEPSPIDLISHSQVERLRSCQLQEAFNRDPQYRHMGAPSTAALLGLVCHQLSEDVARGSVTSAEGLEERWDDLISTAQNRLQDDAFTDPVPTPHEWPGYQLSRARTLIALRQVLGSRPAPAKPARNVPINESDRSMFIELDIVDERSRLTGRIDRVERNPDGTRIVDLKAGWSQEPTITERQRRQLLFYAHLWHERTGEWPKTAMIQLADGRSSEINIDVEEVRTAVSDAVALRRGFNEQLPRGWSGAASPSEDACAFCDFKACCPAFMDKADPSWRIPGTWVRGTVTTTASPTLRSVTLIPDDMAHRTIDEITIVGLPDEVTIEAGERVGFAGLSTTAATDALRATWRTSLAWWNSS